MSNPTSRRGRGQAPTKTCPACGLDLPRSNFKRRSNGHSKAYCDPCQKERDREAGRLRRADPAKAAVLVLNARRTTLRQYGLTIEQFDEMSAKQGGRCAVCGSPPRNGKANLDVDHDHKTGKVRGLLCDVCNRAIGLLGDDAESLARAAQYLKDPA